MKVRFSCDIDFIAARGETFVGLGKILIAGASVVLLGAGYVGARSYATSDGTIASQDLLYRLTVEEEAMRGQKIVAEPPVLKLREGDRVTLLLTAPLPAEVYIHGLETSTTLLPNLETPLAFSAMTPGRYFIHLHNVVCDDQMSDSHVEVAVVEIQPR